MTGRQAVAEWGKWKFKESGALQYCDFFSVGRKPHLSKGVTSK